MNDLAGAEGRRPRARIESRFKKKKEGQVWSRSSVENDDYRIALPPKLEASIRLPRLVGRRLGEL